MRSGALATAVALAVVVPVEAEQLLAQPVAGAAANGAQHRAIFPS